MLDLLANHGGWLGTTVVVIALFVRIEHRLTKVETLITVIAGRLGICQPSSEKPTP